jgi:hypothetical protein
MVGSHNIEGFRIPQLVYNQMWLNILMDDCHFSIAEIIKDFVPNHIGEFF